MIKCRHVTISLTNDCNMHCRDCYIDQKKEYFMAKDLRKKVLDPFLQIGGKSIGFSGGEPLLHPRVMECIAAANDAGMETSLVTNGLLFTEQEALNLKMAGLIRVQLSMDAGNQEANDSLRQKGAFQAVLRQAIPAAKKARLKTTMVAVPNPYLMNNVTEYMDLVMEQGVDAVYFRRFVDVKQELPSVERKAEYHTFLKTLEEIKKRYPMKIYLGDPMHGAMYMEKLSGSSKKKLFAGCSAGVVSLSIQTDGTVYPCTRLPVPIGNVYKDSLADIWENSPVLADLRFRNLSGMCGACSYRYACGGCRAEAYYKGSYLGEDPMCCMRGGVEE